MCVFGFSLSKLCEWFEFGLQCFLSFIWKYFSIFSSVFRFFCSYSPLRSYADGNGSNSDCDFCRIFLEIFVEFFRFLGFSARISPFETTQAVRIRIAIPSELPWKYLSTSSVIRFFCSYLPFETTQTVRIRIGNFPELPWKYLSNSFSVLRLFLSESYGLALMMQLELLCRNSNLVW